MRELYVKVEAIKDKHFLSSTINYKGKPISLMSHGWAHKALIVFHAFEHYAILSIHSLSFISPARSSIHNLEARPLGNVKAGA